MAHIDTKYARRPAKPLKRGPRKPWRAILYYDGKNHYLGHYTTQEEAVTRENVERRRLANERKMFSPHATSSDS